MSIIEYIKHIRLDSVLYIVFFITFIIYQKDKKKARIFYFLIIGVYDIFKILNSKNKIKNSK